MNQTTFRSLSDRHPAWRLLASPHAVAGRPNNPVLDVAIAVEYNADVRTQAVTTRARHTSSAAPSTMSSQ